MKVFGNLLLLLLFAVVVSGAFTVGLVGCNAMWTGRTFSEAAR